MGSRELILPVNTGTGGALPTETVHILKLLGICTSISCLQFSEDLALYIYPLLTELPEGQSCLLNQYFHLLGAPQKAPNAVQC